MITLKRNIVIPHDYYLLTLIVSSKKLRLKMLMKISVRIRKCLDFNNYSGKSKYCDNSKKLVVGKMKDETGGVAINIFV